LRAGRIARGLMHQRNQQQSQHNRFIPLGHVLLRQALDGFVSKILGRRRPTVLFSH
jgi:hypothetical protein